MIEVDWVRVNPIQNHVAVVAHGRQCSRCIRRRHRPLNFVDGADNFCFFTVEWNRIQLEVVASILRDINDFVLLFGYTRRLPVRYIVCIRTSPTDPILWRFPFPCCSQFYWQVARAWEISPFSDLQIRRLGVSRVQYRRILRDKRCTIVDRLIFRRIVFNSGDVKATRRFPLSDVNDANAHRFEIWFCNCPDTVQNRRFRWRQGFWKRNFCYIFASFKNIAFNDFAFLIQYSNKAAAFG